MNQSISRKKNILSYLLLFPIIYILHSIYFSDLKLFLFLVYNIRGLIGLVVMIIAISTYKISQNTLFTLIAISIGICGLIDCVSLILTYHHSLPSILDQHLYLRIFSDFLLIFSLTLSYKLYDINLKLKYVFIIYFTIILSLVLIFTLSLFVFKLFPSLYSTSLLNFNIKGILNLTLFALSLYPLYLYFRIEEEVTYNDLRHIFFLFIITASAQMIFYLAPLTDYFSTFMFLGNTLLLFHLFFICRIVINAVLKKPHKMLFCDLDNKSKEIEKLKDYYETVIESLPLSIIVTHNNKISFTNSTTLKFLNYKSKSQMYDMDLYDILDHKSICDYAYNLYNKTEFFETTLKKSTGDPFYARVRPIDVIFHGDECTMLIIKDISFKQQINELNYTLEQKITEENMKTEFLSNVSHELRTPINVIYSILQLEDIYIKNNDIESITKHNKTLKQNCLRLLRICNNLIDSTKIEAGYFVPNMKYVNIVSLIENIVSSVSSYMSIKNINITFDTEKEEIYAICDHDLIERIILNLVSNSIKYGFDRGNVWVNIYDDGEFAKIVFMDDGPGIAKEKCENIFKRFVQIDKLLSRSCEGSGVGLALVKSLVDMHNGNIEIESDTDMGCKFTILLPSVDCDIDEVAATSDFFVENDSIVDKINIEFSDIYF